MYNVLLFLHFFGISIGAGTGIYLMALSHHASRNLEQAEARTLIPGIAGTISRVGIFGLTLLIISGAGMLYMLGSNILHGVFLGKLVLVLLIVLFVSVMSYLSARVRHKADISAAKTMKRIAVLGPVLGVLTILTAVITFH